VFREKKGKASHSYYGEPLGLWRDQIELMRVATTLWQHASEMDDGALAEILEFRNDEIPGLVTFKVPTPTPSPGYPSSDDWGITSPRALKSNDLVPAAFELVQEILNSQLSQFSLSAKVVWNPNELAMAFQIVPVVLLGAIWLQFAQAVSGNKEYRNCDQCGTPFEISLAPEGKRKNRKFCKDACRFKAYRERQSKARELHAKGLSVSKIAKRLESNTATIKNWIK